MRRKETAEKGLRRLLVLGVFLAFLLLCGEHDGVIVALTARLAEFEARALQSLADALARLTAYNFPADALSGSEEESDSDRDS